MQINADLTERAVVASARLPWVDSPLPGVQRRMLDRDGGEVARASSIVRYAPGSRFDAHVHEAGEEYLVLDGTFSDETGDHHAGTYVRNPPGSRHTPFSAPGCAIFVKLRQFDPRDMARVCIDTKVAPWLPGPANGTARMPLHAFGRERVSLVRWDAGVRQEAHMLAHGAEILVLEGSFADEHGRYEAKTWLRNPAGHVHAPFTETGCVLYLKSGHLPVR